MDAPLFLYFIYFAILSLSSWHFSVDQLTHRLNSK